MKIIKAIIAGAIGMSVFLTLLSLLITARPQVSRMVVINTADSKKIMQQVANLHQWKNWHPLFASDSSILSFGKNAQGQSSSQIVYNNKTTQLSITHTDSLSVHFLLQARGENDISNQVYIQSMPGLQQSTVYWVATTHLHWYFPWEKLYAIFIDKLTGPGYEAALNGLKQFIESTQPK